MQKTKLGISVAFLGAIICFSALFGGTLATLVAAGYILMFEDNEWLRMTAVKALVISIGFSAIISAVQLIPGALNVVSSFLAILTINFHFAIINNLINFVTGTIDFVQSVLLIVLGFKALKQGTIMFPFLDKFMIKHF